MSEGGGPRRFWIQAVKYGAVGVMNTARTVCAHAPSADAATTVVGILRLTSSA